MVGERTCCRSRKNSRNNLFIRFRSTDLPNRREVVMPRRDRCVRPGAVMTKKCWPCRFFPRCCKSRNSRRARKPCLFWKRQQWGRRVHRCAGFGGTVTTRRLRPLSRRRLRTARPAVVLIRLRKP
jgi:hypothetical protein